MLLPLALGLALLNGCSVKEDRASCPCRLDILIPESGTSPELMFSVRDRHKEICSGSVEMASGGRCLTVDVPKDLISVYALDKREGIGLIGRYVHIAEGCQSDSLYSFYASVNCVCESAVVTVSTMKQFSTISVKFGPECFDAGEVSGVRVRGNVSGLDLETMSPLAGPFSFECPLDQDMTCSIRVPRQDDDSLELDALAADGSTVCSFPLGRMISGRGFDWHEKALKDILVDIDGSSEFDVRIDVAEWETGLI